jgi:hypothetical protein
MLDALEERYGDALPVDQAYELMNFALPLVKNLEFRNSLLDRGSLFATEGEIGPTLLPKIEPHSWNRFIAGR